jgi:hypothetical protein
MTNAANLAKIAGITEQQAVTMAVIVNYNMRHAGMSMEQAVASYMKSMKELASAV